MRATYNNLQSHFTAIENVEQPSKRPRPWSAKPIDIADQQLRSARQIRRRNQARAQPTSATTDFGFVYAQPAQGDLETTDPVQSPPTSPTPSLPAFSNYEPSIAPTSKTSISFQSISTQSTQKRTRKRPVPTSNESCKRQKKSNEDQVPSETQTVRKQGRRATQVAQTKSPQRCSCWSKSLCVKGPDAASSCLGGQPASADSATAGLKVQSNCKNKQTALSPVTKKVKRAQLGTNDASRCDPPLSGMSAGYSKPTQRGRRPIKVWENSYAIFPSFQDDKLVQLEAPRDPTPDDSTQLVLRHETLPQHFSICSRAHPLKAPRNPDGPPTYLFHAFPLPHWSGTE